MFGYAHCVEYISINLFITSNSCGLGLFKPKYIYFGFVF